MPVPHPIRNLVDLELAAFCDRLVPPDLRTHTRLTMTWEGPCVTLIRSDFKGEDLGATWVETPIARFQYNPVAKEWALSWRTRKGAWFDYPDMPDSPTIRHLLQEVDKDPHGIFWGE